MLRIKLAPVRSPLRLCIVVNLRRRLWYVQTCEWAGPGYTFRRVSRDLVANIIFPFQAVKPDPYAISITFPRERLGLNYDLNAVLNSQHRLTPYGDAFRNLYSRHLMMLSTGKLGTLLLVLWFMDRN